MKTILLSLGIFALQTGMHAQTKPAASPAEAATSWKVDPVHSSVKFSVVHLMISDVEGNFKVYSGTINSPKPGFADASIAFEVDVNSINTENEMRDKHLKSDDFFNAEKYPKMTFKSSSFKKVKGDEYQLEGELTIRDVTKHVKFNVVHRGVMKDAYGNTKAGFKATTKINRKDYGLKFGAVTETGGAVVSDEVNIILNLEFALQKS